LRRGRGAAAGVLVIACSAHASDGVKFDATLLRSARHGAVDVSAFETRDGVAAGLHEVEVARNGVPLGRRRVRFDANGVACIDAAFADWLGVAMTRDALETRGCRHIGDIHAAARAEHDAGELTLHVTLPQALLRRRDDAIDPALLDPGMSALRFGVGAHVSHHVPRDGASAWRQGSLRIDAGANTGAWRLRHRGTQTWAPMQGRRSHPLSTTLERDVLRFDARLAFGDLHASDRVFEPVALRGVRFQSDDRMVSATQLHRGPVVRGIADSHARVRVTHEGRLLLDTTVPPGPFALDSVRPPGRGGVLSVEVIEADGRTHVFDVPHAWGPGLLREGRARFGLAAGLLRDVAGDVPLLQGVAQRGVTDRLTLHGGARLASGHAEALTGVAVATHIGAWSFDRTQSRTTIGTRREGGGASRLAWAMEWLDGGTALDLAAWRRDHPGVHALRDAMHAQRTDMAPLHPLRARLDVSLRHTIQRRHALTFGYVDRRHHARAPVRSVQLGASMPAGRDGAWLHALVERSSDRGRNAPHATLALSLPLTTGSPRTPTFAHAHARAGPDGHSLQSGVGGAFGPDARNGWRVGVAHAQRFGVTTKTMNAAASHLGRAGRIDLGAASTPSGQQWSLSGEGAAVVHPHGVTFGAALGDTIALVRATHGAGARLLQDAHVALDRRGRALVPSLSPYRRNRVGVDPAGASPEVAFDWTERDVIPRAGAIVDIALPTMRATAHWLRIVDAAGAPVRFGARVVDGSARARGLVGRDGHAYVQAEPGDTLHLLWHDTGIAWRCTLATRNADDANSIHTARCIDAIPQAAP
jgi:outer membrane usher protein